MLAHALWRSAFERGWSRRALGKDGLSSTRQKDDPTFFLPGLGLDTSSLNCSPQEQETGYLLVLALCH